MARALARSDPARAEKVAESIDSPGTRGAALVAVADALPTEARDRKLALLARAAVHAKAAKEPLAVFEVAELARAGREGKGQGPGRRICWLWGKSSPSNALLRLPAGPCRPAGSPEHRQGVIPPAVGRSANWMLRNIAFGLAADNPAEAERVLRMVPQEEGRNLAPPAIAWKMAMSRSSACPKAG